MLDQTTSTTTPAVATPYCPANGWEELASRFKAHQRKTAEAVIAMGKIVHEAKHDLPADDFKRFVTDTRLQGSTERKYECIGQCANVFERHLNRLPATWTSLYELTKIDPVTLEEQLTQGLIWPQMTGKDIQDLLRKLGIKSSILNKKPKCPPEQTGYTLSIRFARTPKTEVISQLEQLITEFVKKHDVPADLSLSELLAGLMEQSTGTSEEVEA